jgi:hypothetical protein
LLAVYGPAAGRGFAPQMSAKTKRYCFSLSILDCKPAKTIYGPEIKVCAIINVVIYIRNAFWL